MSQLMSLLGVALGVERHSDDVTAILIAILSHKFFSGT